MKIKIPGWWNKHQFRFNHSQYGIDYYRCKYCDTETTLNKSILKNCPSFDYCEKSDTPCTFQEWLNGKICGYGENVYFSVIVGVLTFPIFIPWAFWAESTGKIFTNVLEKSHDDREKI